MTFLPNTIVFTRGGRKAEILAVLPAEKAADGQTIVALVEGFEPGDYSVETYFGNGRYANNPSGWDLMPAAPVTVLADRIRQVARQPARTE